jgi:hypothetical protein
VHFDDGLPDQGRSEESPKGDQKVAASNSGQVEQGIGNLDRYKNTNMKVREDKVTNKIEERIK